MLFGSMFQEQQNSSKNFEDNEVQRMRREILQNLNDAQQYLQTRSCKSNTNDFTMDESGHLVAPEYDDAVDYYKEFWKLFLDNEIRMAELKQVSSRTQALKQKVSAIEKLEEAYFSTIKLRNKKKHRRPAVEIDKSHSCPYENCYKNYGSDVSLNLHIKIKHNGGNKTDRQKLAQQLCLYEIGKGPKPILNIQFPPGFLEGFREQFNKKMGR